MTVTAATGFYSALVEQSQRVVAKVSVCLWVVSARAPVLITVYLSDCFAFRLVMLTFSCIMF